jgi:GMP synthase-like glutamine amidotransferase
MTTSKKAISVYIVGYAPKYAQMFVNNGWFVVDRLEEADIMLLTGGPDINPKLYGEDPHPLTRYVTNVDDRELKAVSGCTIPIVGICRGAQLLNCLAGGSMYQHVDGHNNGHHPMSILEGKRANTRIEVSSTHHQMMIPGPGASVLACAEISTVRDTVVEGEVQTLFRGAEKDPEVLLYPKEKFLCYQPHPELFDTKHLCQIYFLELVEALLNEN